MRTTAVARIMTTQVQTLNPGSTVGEALSCFLATGHGGYPLVDASGACTGIVTRSDLLREGLDSDAPVTSIATADPVTVTPGTLALDALHAMLQEGVEHLPVVADGRLVGICTRTDLLRTRREQFELERSQPGWHLPTMIRRSRAATPGVTPVP
jgi:CBS domain-containing protein